MGCSTSLEVRQCRRHLTSRSANRLEVGEEAMRLPLDAKSSSLVEYSSFYRWPHFCSGRSRLAACLRFHTFANRVLTSITFCASNAAGCRLMAKAYQVSTSSASFCFAVLQLGKLINFCRACRAAREYSPRCLVSPFRLAVSMVGCDYSDRSSRS